MSLGKVKFIAIFIYIVLMGIFTLNQNHNITVLMLIQLVVSIFSLFNIVVFFTGETMAIIGSFELASQTR